MAPKPKANRYFQTAVLDPMRKIASREQRVYRFAEASKAPPLAPPIAGTMKVIVGSDATCRRTWNLSKQLLSRHSPYFSLLIHQDAEKSEVELGDVDPRTFGNLVDYMYSSIYSLNTQVVGYRPIVANAMACILGEKLGMKAYCDAAIRQLYLIFDPLARLRTSNARKSPIQASDIKYICTHTSPSVPTSSGVSGIRQLFFDAVASHWTQNDVLSVGAHDTPGDKTSWTDVYNQYFDFRITLATSVHMADVWRAAILRPVDDYLNSPLNDITLEIDSRSSHLPTRLFPVQTEPGVRNRVIAQPTARIPALKRSASGKYGSRRELSGVVTDAARYKEDERVSDEDTPMKDWDDTSP